MLDFLSLLTNYTDYSLIVLRFVVAAIFFYHGTNKLKNAKGPFFALGIFETLGSVAMFTGFLTQLTALGLTFIMMGAMYFKKYKWHLPFSSEANTGYEFDMMIWAANISLLFSGGGAFSLDRVWFNL